MHDMTISQPFKYRLSYMISAIYQTLLVVELARAYSLLKKKLTVKEVEEKLGNEKVQMYTYWTKGLKEKEKV
jgi:hypothetical protein